MGQETLTFYKWICPKPLIFMKTLQRKLKISLTLRFMTKEEQKRPLATAKKQKSNWFDEQ